MNTKMLIKTPEEIAIMRDGCRMLAQVVDALAPMVSPGTTGLAIDAFAEAEIRKRGCVPSFKGYTAGGAIPFPGTLCFSVNEGIVHGIPNDYKIQDGDLVKIDIGLIYKNYHADMARTFAVGNAGEEAVQLRAHTKKAFEKGFAQLHDGATLNDYAGAVQNYAQGQGYSVVKSLIGHGIGTALHMPPQIPNYISAEFDNFTFHAGMTVALEPMVNCGSDGAVLGDDGWTYVTPDRRLSAHWENTVLITRDGAEILTHI